MISIATANLELIMAAKIIIPAGYGLTRYTVRRDRAQRSWFTLDYYNNGWLRDNQVEPEERKNVDVDRPINNPAAFVARDRPFDIQVGGCWFNENGNEHPIGFARMDVDVTEYVQYVVGCYTGDRDPNACVVAILSIGRG